MSNELILLIVLPIIVGFIIMQLLFGGHVKIARFKTNPELHKLRLATYPQLHQLLQKLSPPPHVPLTAEQCHHIATEINNWLYSAGGLYTESETRTAIINLRDLCLDWDGDRQQLAEGRDTVLHLLRKDIGIED